MVGHDQRARQRPVPRLALQILLLRGPALAPGGAGAGLARLAEASGDRRGRLAQPRLGTRQLVLGAVLP
jgi:hypothetical protein